MKGEAVSPKKVQNPVHKKRANRINSRVARESRTPEAGFVYFIEHNSNFKIGFTKDLRSRMEELRNGDQLQLGRRDIRLLVTLRGGRDYENIMHNAFHESRVYCDSGSSELFSGESRDLGDYIRWLRKQYWCAIDEDKAYSIDKQPLSDINPNDRSRRVPPPELPGGLFGGDLDNLDFPPVNLTEDYYTPPHIVAPIRVFFGGIELDPASSVEANETIKAERYYTVADNGLLQSWASRTFFANPPFNLMGEFCEKFLQERHAIGEAVILHSAPAITAQYMERVLRSAAAVAVIIGRPKFGGLGGTGSPTSGFCLQYHGERPQGFCSAVSGFAAPFTNASH